jgi:Ni/Co efflux regulator RcnB
MKRAVFAAMVLVFLSSSAHPVAQRQQPGVATEPVEEKWERDRKKAMNKDRQSDLKKDTEKLLQLATELKQYVDKTNENMLSVEVLKKTEEIEKLAKKVREKMKAENLMPGPALK